MLKNKLYKKFLIASIVGTLCISSGVMAFASTTKSVVGSKSKVASKSIGGFKHKEDGQKGQFLGNIIKTEVTAGVLTQAEADKITAYLTTKEATEKAKVTAMTAAEKKVYFEANKSTKVNITAELVTNNLLTDSQATALQAAMAKMPAGSKDWGKEKGSDKQRGSFIAADLLKAQVTANVINQATSDKITAFIKTKEEAKKTEMTAQKAKFATMTDAEKKAYFEANKATFEANKPAKTSIFAELVSAGILTQDQASKLQAAMPKMPTGDRGHGHDKEFN